MAKKATTEAARSTAMVKVSVQETSNGLQKINLGATDAVPDLDTFNVAPIDLSADYWTPENIGEEKRMIFQKIATRDFEDEQTGEVKPLETAFFLSKEGDSVKSVTNSSKRLVAALVNMGVEKGTPLLIRYLGKKKNTKNAFQSDRWSIRPLFVNVEAQTA